MKHLKSLFVLLILAGSVALTGLFAKKDQKKDISVQGTETQPAQQPVTFQTIAVEGGNFYFSPNELRVKKGKPVQISYTSKNGLHDVVIAEFGVGSDVVSAGQTTTIAFTPDKVGTFEFYCSIGRHREMGMKGALIVEE